ncbi:MAG TPA: Ig-like domain-containing protein [Arachidicoccus sp.]
MKKILFLVVIAFVFLWMMPSGCAVIVPPTGGPKDSLPPVFMGATPKDSTLNFKEKLITLNFNEYINLDNVFTNLIVSPTPKHTPTIIGHLRQVTIRIKDTLEPNTTYSYNFGKSIKDVNEGNMLRNFTYVFSTGGHIDTSTISGTVKLAQTGGVDSTILVVLYTDFSDTAVYKTQPKYYTTLDSAGKFAFHFLPKAKFKLFAVANSYMKNYADSTTQFAFLDSTLNTGSDSLAQNQNLRLYAFQAYQKEEKKTSTANLSDKQKEKRKEQDAKKALTITNNLEQGKQSLLTPFKFTYSKPLKSFDSTQILLTDTNNVKISNYMVYHDSTDTTNTRFILKTAWLEDSSYRLIIPTGAAKDSFDIALKKADTVSFQAKNNHDYATIELNFPDVDTILNPVLQILTSDNKLLDSIRITASRKVTLPMYEPGKYNFRILYDKNGDMKWTPGNYKKRLQPEIVVGIRSTFEFIADTENQWDIHLKAPDEPKYNPLKL